ncbi:fructose-6-phosphate aldolase [Blattabacterium cuenoti]|uniref:fructose-6-phosphate aldolase n=1 Tax=Blattabacterium cuenoti TaxID=1653831 RepID=UPI00163CFBB3|nr:fructose-6-phosphate aldolase [Blattabacterium cuenoti]
MKFFLDTANLEEIKQAISIGILDGVTTNPSLIARESLFNKKDIQKHYKNICYLLNKNEDLSAEVISNNYNDIIEEGIELSSLHPKIVVKIPATKIGIKAIKFFSEKKINTNCTLVFSAGQAILAAKSGATYISPFLGRLDDVSYDGLNLIRDIKIIYDEYRFNTKILAASIRNPIHIIECAKMGIYAITSPINVINHLFNHPLTNIGLENFLKEFNNF